MTTVLRIFLKAGNSKPSYKKATRTYTDASGNICKDYELGFFLNTIYDLTTQVWTHLMCCTKGSHSCHLPFLAKKLQALINSRQYFV